MCYITIQINELGICMSECQKQVYYLLNAQTANSLSIAKYAILNNRHMYMYASG